MNLCIGHRLFLSAFVMGVLSLTMVTSGCGESLPPGPARAQVTGTVTFAGKPVPYGTITFVPEPGSGLPVSGADIRNGKYEVTNHGGVPVGKHRVEIHGWDSSPANLGPADVSDAAVKPLIPEKFNTQSELKLTVESAAPVQKDFDLK